MEYLSLRLDCTNENSLACFSQMGALPENSFRGMASVFNGLIDSWVPTVIHPGAFTKTLQENGKRVKILYQHDSAEPVGVPEFMQETNSGLAVQGRISMTQRGKDALQLMRDGVIDALSIGFDPIKDELEYGPNGDVIMRHIREVRLWEFSLVTWGADSAAQITEVHSFIGRLEQSAVSPFGDLPLYDRNTSWEAGAAEERVKTWSGVTDKPNTKYRRAFLWYDPTNADTFGGYKLPFADVTGGALKAVPRGIFAAAAALQGARGGVNIPDADKAKAKAVLEKYYAKMRTEFNDDTIVAPWVANSSIGEYETEDALYLFGQILLAGVSFEHATSLFNKIGVVPETHTPSTIDIESLLLDAELIFMQTESE